MALAAALAGCATAPSGSERMARARVAEWGAALRPAEGRKGLPVLRSDSSLEEYLRFGVLKHPGVEAAWHEWRGSVEAIAVARSLPDPRITFEADVMDTLLTLMPGLMGEFTAGGKRAAMAGEAAANSEVAYRAYASALLRVAADIRKAWVEIAYVEEALRLYQATIQNVEQSAAVAGVEFSTGRGIASLDELVRLQNLAAEHHAHHAVVAERLATARATLKSALGLSPAEADPPWPRPPLAASELPSEDELWRRALAANPELETMRALAEAAAAQVAVARQARTPDASVGLMADVKASPLMLRPVASLSLPIWRDKIAAAIEAAEARRAAAAARLGAEELNLAADLARMLFLVHEADRMIAYIDGTALPNLERVVAAAEAGYQSGASAAGIPEARHRALTLQLERANALRERELAAADLLVLFTGGVPAGVPLLAGGRAENR